MAFFEERAFKFSVLFDHRHGCAGTGLPGGCASRSLDEAQSIGLNHKFVASCTIAVLLLASFCIDQAQKRAGVVTLRTRYLLTLKL